VNEDLSFFVALERQVWEALQRGDAAADARLLADKFLGVYDSGFESKGQHVARAAKGPALTHFALEMPRLIRVSADLALLAYKARWTDKEEKLRAAYISSLWERAGEGWLNIFSQDTNV
jgi:hypothetical protein